MLRKVGRGLVILAMITVELPLILATALTLILAFGLGLVPLYPPLVRLVRRTAGITRRQVTKWCGVEIEDPYLPAPPPPIPQADGLYRYDRTLYKTPRIPMWNARWKWMFADPATWRDFLWLLLDPLVKLALALPFLFLAPHALYAYGKWAAFLLAPTAKSKLIGQVVRLNVVRSQAVDSQAAEMRRIERDLHDGAQARLVALGLTLGAVDQLVDTNPVAAKALLNKAMETSSEALAELRRVVRGIHPPVLAERGIGDAVRALALDSPLKVTVELDLPHRPQPPVEAAIYFAVSELLSNAARHGSADQVTIDISHRGRMLCVTVMDDGLGGADPSKGSGLRGIERRLAAFDGVIALMSPPGGPTTVSMSVPDALPEEYAGGSSRLPRWKSAIVVVGWSLGWLPLFPQGVVAGVFKAFNIDEHEKAWFLALYLPPPWQWPTITLMMCLGVAMYGAALYIPLQHSAERWLAEAHPRRPWFDKC